MSVHRFYASYNGFLRDNVAAVNQTFVH